MTRQNISYGIKIPNILKFTNIQIYKTCFNFNLCLDLILTFPKYPVVIYKKIAITDCYNKSILTVN